jgi:hypothetical protein
MWVPLLAAESAWEDKQQQWQQQGSASSPLQAHTARVYATAHLQLAQCQSSATFRCFFKRVGHLPWLLACWRWQLQGTLSSFKASTSAAAAACAVPALNVLLAAFSWPPAEWSLPAHDDPRQTAYQQGVVYSLEYELQVQQVDVGPPNDNTPAEQLLQQVFGALNSKSWRCVASVVGPMQSAVQVSTLGQCSSSFLLSWLCQLPFGTMHIYFLHSMFFSGKYDAAQCA